MKMNAIHVPFPSRDDSALLPLSIVVATTKPWPEIRGCLDSLLNQAATVGAEILVADGNGQGLPDEGGELYARVIWLKDPGASVFSLRRLAWVKHGGKLLL